MRLRYRSEWLYPLWALFYAAAGARAFIFSERFDAAAFALWCLLVGGLAASKAFEGSPSPVKAKAALLYFPVAMNLSFQWIGWAYGTVAWRADRWLLAADEALLGGTPAMWAAQVRGFWTDNAFACAYMSFIAFLFYSLIRFAFLDLDRARRAYGALFSAYAVGFLGYAAAPAAGPWKALPELARFLERPEGVFASANWAMVLAGSNGVDVFPSLHVGISALLLWIWRDLNPKTTAFLAWPVAALCVSTLWLGYHYFVDVAAGAALAVAALKIHSPKRGEKP